MEKNSLEVVFSHKSDDWETPQNLFDELNEEFHFTLDVCANSGNAKCDNYFTELLDGLLQTWSQYCNWCNPPYSQVGLWVRKAYEQQQEGKTTVMLVPSRTDTKWFHEHCYNKPNVEIRFIKGRLKFSNSKNSAPFPSMIIIFKGIKNG